MGTTSADSHGEMSSDQAHPPRATTYEQAQDAYLCTSDACERYEELANRDVTVRAFATLQARGTYDPERHGDAREYAPLTADEHLEILAAGEVLARHYRHPAQLHRAVQAGASWPQIAAATGSDEAAVRHAYREWADGQRRLHIDYEGEFGLNAAEHSAALHRAAEPEPERAPHGATPDRNRETGLPGPLTVAYAPRTTHRGRRGHHGYSHRRTVGRAPPVRPRRPRRQRRPLAGTRHDVPGRTQLRTGGRRVSRRATRTVAGTGASCRGRPLREHPPHARTHRS